MKESIIERIRETGPGETICLNHEECKEVIRMISGWHKATELPKETGDYVVTIIEMERWKSVTTRNYRLSSGWGLFSNEKLVCWMPLPEPPKEGETE